MLNFAVGPVMSYKETLAVASESTPYFRTNDFSNVMLENEKYILNFVNAPNRSRAAFLTSSGTGAMESCVLNILNHNDKVLVINGGSFGERFYNLCILHKIKTTELKLNFGQQITDKKLEAYGNKGYTALLVNMCETSSGILYDMNLISKFCKKNNVLLIVDAISSFLADSINMSSLGISALILSSQKGLAVQPGVSIIVMTKNIQRRIALNDEKCLYLSLKEALSNGERGQTPFTPAVSILLQINKRLKMIDRNGGIEKEINKIHSNAIQFRNGISDLPIDFVTKDKSNCVTAIKLKTKNAKKIVEILKNKYHIWICPNGGKYADNVFRVGHIGNITRKDNNILIDALHKKLIIDLL